ncbi:unnamed protein product [Sphagnum jensenii]|uniref:Uncharacterized protein n=1 Tax=Sphagnum jensenii TaxID=128206 RepID=A0ABP0XC97_9BRYO
MLKQLHAVLQHPRKHRRDVRPAVGIPGASCAHFSNQNLLSAEIDRKRVSTFVELAILDIIHSILHVEVELVQGASDPVGRVRCLLHELSDNAGYSSGHRRLAVRHDTKKLVAPAIVQTHEQLDHRLGNIVGGVLLKERQDDQMKVVELASDTNAKTHVEK